MFHSINLLHHIRRLLLLHKIFMSRIYISGHIQFLKFFIKRYVFRNKIPMTVMIALTYKCQCNCVHCAVSRLEDNMSAELSTEEIKKIIYESQRIGVLKIGFTGGEPLIRYDIPELVNYAYKKGLSTSIDTNGILLTERMVSDLKMAGISNVNVSIDHPVSNYHDRLRKYKGCYDKAISGIKNCVKQKIPCSISTYLTNRSFDKGEIWEIIRLSRELNVSGVRVIFPIYSGKFDNKKRPLLSEYNKEKFFNTAINGLFVYSESPFFDFITKRIECSSERKLSVYVTAYGDLKYCYVSPNSLGNIRVNSLSKIFGTNSYFNFSDKIKINCSCPEDNKN